MKLQKAIQIKLKVPKHIEIGLNQQTDEFIRAVNFAINIILQEKNRFTDMVLGESKECELKAMKNCDKTIKMNKNGKYYAKDLDGKVVCNKCFGYMTGFKYLSKQHMGNFQKGKERKPVSDFRDRFKLKNYNLYQCAFEKANDVVKSHYKKMREVKKKRVKLLERKIYLRDILTDESKRLTVSKSDGKIFNENWNKDRFTHICYKKKYTDISKKYTELGNKVNTAGGKEELRQMRFPFYTNYKQVKRKLDDTIKRIKQSYNIKKRPVYNRPTVKFTKGEIRWTLKDGRLMVRLLVNGNMEEFDFYGRKYLDPYLKEIEDRIGWKKTTIPRKGRCGMCGEEERTISFLTTNGLSVCTGCKTDSQPEISERDGEWYLNYMITKHVEPPSEGDITHIIGVDIGIRKLAVVAVFDKSQNRFVACKFCSGNGIRRVQTKYKELRQRMTTKYDPLTKRRIPKKIRDGDGWADNPEHERAVFLNRWGKPMTKYDVHGALEKYKNKERNTINTILQQTSYDIIRFIKDTIGSHGKCEIKLEYLKGLRENIIEKNIMKYNKKYRRPRNRMIGSFVYNKFQNMLTYKTEWEGWCVRKGKADYTSQKCSRCGHTENKNRLTQRCFKCQKCGYTINADLNAAFNIAKISNHVHDRIQQLAHTPGHGSGVSPGISERPRLVGL